MNVAFCAYNGMTALGFIGMYDPLTRLDRMDFVSLEWDVCARSKTVMTNRLSLNVERISPNLGEYDLVFLPGGYASRKLRHDEAFVEWLQTSNDCEYKTAVCTGSLLLGAAGFLSRRRATTHPSPMEILSEYADAVDDRVVRDGPIITGRGVSSAIDLGLVVVEMLTDSETRSAIAEQMDYPYGNEAQAGE